MVSAPALLQRGRHLLSPGTSNPNVHAVAAWKMSSLQHILVASCGESQCSKPMPASLRAAYPKVEAREEKEGGKSQILLALPSRKHNQQVQCCTILSQADQYVRKPSDLYKSSCLAAVGSCQVVGGWRMCWERGNSEQIFVLAKMLQFFTV